MFPDSRESTGQADTEAAPLPDNTARRLFSRGFHGLPGKAALLAHMAEEEMEL